MELSCSVTLIAFAPWPQDAPFVKQREGSLVAAIACPSVIFLATISHKAILFNSFFNSFWRTEMLTLSLCFSKTTPE
jgi:hypothetical protein